MSELTYSHKMERIAYDQIDALNFSRATALLRSPAHYKVLTEITEDDLKHVVGKLAHAMVLENKDLRSTFAIKPAGMKFTTMEGKAWRDAQHRPILKSEDSDKVGRIAQAISKHPQAVQMIRRCQEREHCVLARLGGTDCKSLLDAVGYDEEKRRGFLEIKTTQDARPAQFKARIMDLNYDMQVVWYSMMLMVAENLEEPPWCCWIAVEVNPPFAVACYNPSALMIKSGRLKLAAALEIYETCRANCKWPAYHEDIMELDPPEWRIQQLGGRWQQEYEEVAP